MVNIWLIIILFLFILFQKYLYSKYIFSNIDIDRKFKDNHIFCEETTEYALSIKNNKLLPVTYLNVIERFPKEIQFEKSNINSKGDKLKYKRESVFSIMPFEKVTRRYNIKATKRGYYELFDKITLISTDIFGSNEYVKDIYFYERLIVYPKIIDIKNILNSLNTLQGEYIVKRWIIDDPLMISGIRDYTSVDSIKNINWKAVAKNQKLKVNTYDYTSDKKIILAYILEVHDYIASKEDLENIETGIQIVASIGIEFINQGIKVGFTTNAFCKEDENIFIYPSNNKSQISNILTACSKITDYKKYSVKETIQKIQNQFNFMYDLILVTNNCTQRLLSELESFNDKKFTVITVDNKENIEKSNINLISYRGDDYL
ncbi:Protein of unknown function DUF58 [Alkalithermobacter thermoalcaliphilus JW-YL-7 = DSM 7308]|uniref:DUF58 domain-containing protein n=1 Tax=Alkalithermobacter thermoalcaliphilus JW-YL-7 = DSM 7308 TaxID=1121328 RepID=A0A150FSU5_CLOPD|nr:protein of unknown function DUF58 [[Clostridium] paradoxum JW-YL-7 = DSM 7308]SHL17941.1 Protein of unknown function DUF58 [[Clostridium] paradoxum JW-YL-7 = DSM 7308]